MNRAPRFWCRRPREPLRWVEAAEAWCSYEPNSAMTDDSSEVWSRGVMPLPSTRHRASARARCGARFTYTCRVCDDVEPAVGTDELCHEGDTSNDISTSPTYNPQFLPMPTPTAASDVLAVVQPQHEAAQRNSAAQERVRHTRVFHSDVNSSIPLERQDCLPTITITMANAGAWLSPLAGD